MIYINLSIIYNFNLNYKMKKPYKSSNSITNYSRAQTAKLRKTLTKTLQNIRNKKLNEDSKSNFLIHKRPITAYLQNMKQINPIYLSTNSNNNKNSSFKNLTRPNSEKYNLTTKFTEKNEYQKAHLNEVNIQNLFTEKLWEKNNKEKNEDYTKKLAYRKLIMRARLLKAMKNNIVLKQNQYNEYNEKYSKGNKLLSEKLKNRNKFKKNESDDEDSYSESSEKEPPLPNFNSLKYPDLFSNYEFTSLFKDYHCTPLELIKKIFNPEEQKIINLDPIFFRLNKEPFTGVQKNLRFNLKDKINEEDRIFQQKLKMAKERNKKFYFLQKKKEEKQLKKNKQVKSLNSLSENEKNEFDDNLEIIKTDNKIINIENKSNSNINFMNKQKKNKSHKKNKNYKTKGNKTFSKIRNKKKVIDFNINTEYNVYLEIQKANLRNRIATGSNQLSSQMYSGEEKIKDKKKKLTMKELFEMYNERKKTYLDDMSYNRTRNKYRFEQLKIKHQENMEKEKEKKENLRQIMNKIEQNYKIYQK